MHTLCAFNAMRFAIDEMECEALKRLLASSTIEAMNVPHSVSGFKSLTDDGQTATSTDGAVHSVIVQLAIDLTVDLIVSAVDEGHMAACTSEAVCMPMPGAILAVEVLTFINGLAATSAHNRRFSTVSVSSAERTTVTDGKRAVDDAVACGTTEVFCMPELAHGIDLLADDDSLAASRTDRAFGLPACGAEVPALKRIVHIGGEGLVARSAEEVLRMEGITASSDDLLSSNGASAVLADVAATGPDACAGLDGGVHLS